MVPLTAAILSSQTAVEFCATLASCAPSVPPTDAAPLVTSAAQKGLMNPVAPAYGFVRGGGGGVGVPVGVAVGVDVGVDVGVGVVPGVPGVGDGVVEPVLQAFPFTLKLVGTGLLPDHAPLKPGLTDPFTATLPL